MWPKSGIWRNEPHRCHCRSHDAPAPAACSPPYSVFLHLHGNTSNQLLSSLQSEAASNSNASRIDPSFHSIPSPRTRAPGSIAFPGAQLKQSSRRGTGSSASQSPCRSPAPSQINRGEGRVGGVRACGWQRCVKGLRQAALGVGAALL